jgi:hypothetical protein
MRKRRVIYYMNSPIEMCGVLHPHFQPVYTGHSLKGIRWNVSSSQLENDCPNTRVISHREVFPDAVVDGREVSQLRAPTSSQIRTDGKFAHGNSVHHCHALRDDTNPGLIDNGE